MKKQTFVRKKGLGKHLFKYGGKTYIISGGDQVICTVEALGRKQIRNYTCTSDRDLTSEKKEKQPTSYVLPIIVQRKTAAGYYDIFNPMNLEKPLNSKALRKKEAEDIIEKYTALRKDGFSIDIDQDFESVLGIPKKRRRKKVDKGQK